MHISPIDLVRTVQAAATITEQYALICPDPHAVERSIDWLHLAVEQNLNASIRMVELHLDKTPETTVFGACIMKGDDSYDIAYVRGLNACWSRFVKCKELFHALIDRPEYRDIGIEAHVEAVTVSFPDDDSHPSSAVAAEFLAEVGAMEFLFPFADRLKVLEAQPIDSLEIATRYRIPRVIVEKFLSNNFMTNLGAVQAEIAKLA